MGRVIFVHKYRRLGTATFYSGHHAGWASGRNPVADIADLWLPCPQIPRGLAGIHDNGLAWQCAALLSDSLGQVHIGAGLASIINATTPIFTILIAGTFLSDEHITPKKVLGMSAGLIGVIVLIGPPALLELGTNTMAQLAVIGGAVSYSCATVFGRRFKAMGISPFDTAVGQVTASTIILLPVVWFIDKPLQLANPSVQVWLAILALAIFSTAFAYILFFRILSSSGATNVVLVTFLAPVTASFFSWLILGEQLQTKHFIGMACIGLGLAIIDGRLWARLRR